MKAKTVLGAVLVAVLAWLCVSGDELIAAPTKAQRKALSAARKKISQTNTLIRRKKLKEAEKLLGEAEAAIRKVIADAMLKPTDRSVAGLLKFLSLQQRKLTLRQGKKPMPASAKSVSFVKDVAPILTARCLTCHGNRASGGLRIDTFAGLSRGGRNGRVIQAGKPATSRLMARVTATNAAQRMPRNGAPLTAAQLKTLAAWITQGAKFDGGNVNTRLSQLKSAGGGTPKKTAKPVSVNVVKATGKEKVSFIKDVAPTFVTLCATCHGGRNGRGGFSVATFESVLRGSTSGRVVLPGNPDGSIIWRRVAAKDAGKQKMPPGNRRIEPAFFRSLKIWIEEGAKFDGESATVSLRSLVPTSAELRAAELAKMSEGDFNAFREKRTDELWDRVISDDRPRFVKSKQFYVYGDVPGARLQQIAEWAEDHGQRLKKMFGERSGPLFRGKLAIIVFKERFGYTEWNQVIHNRETPGAMTGHSVVTSTFEDAYVVLQDVGDVVSGEAAGLRLQLVDHVTGAFLKRKGGRVPQWVVRGTGLVLAARADPKNEYLLGLRDTAIEAIEGLTKPEDLFADGTFSPSEVGAVGYTLVGFMIKAGTGPRFVRFVSNLQNGTAVAATIKATYPATSLKQLAAAYVRSLSGKKKR